MLQPCVLLPVGQVNLAQPANDQLQLLLVKGGEEVLWQQFSESLLQRPKLLFNAVCEAVVDVQLDVLALVCLSHRQVLARWLQLLNRDLPKGVVIHAEGDVL